MLFDLRGRGRRRVISVIYVGLALLIGVGLVGFGIGGGLGGGGILNAANNNEGAGGASFASKIKKYRKLTQTQPNNPAGWEGLSKNLLHEAGGEAYTSASGAITSKGKELFKQASEAWTRYLALNPSKPNAELAQLVYVIYGEAGLNEPAKAVQALQIVVAARPESAAFYSQLAEFAYKAKNTRIGDLSSKKAIELAPSSARARLKSELEEGKKHPNGGQTYVTTTNGKTYELKKSPSGTFTGKQVATAPAGAVTAPSPATTKSTTTKK